MPGVGDVLQRFRPAGAPGAAAAAGVPVDRVAEVEAELAPVFLLLEEVERACARIREQGATEAENRRRAALAAVDRVLAEAHEQAAVEHANSALRRRRQHDDERRQLLAAAAREADEVRRRARERMPGLIDRVVLEVRHRVLATSDGGPAAERAVPAGGVR